MLLVLSVVALSAALAQAAKRTEYVGLAPAGLKNQPGPGSPLIKWAALTYDGTETQASAVGWEMLTAAAPELGAWYNLDLSVGGGSGAALSAKTIGDKLYVYVDKTATGQGGCCADTFRTYDRATGKATEVDLSAMMKAVFPPEVAFHEATHTFDVEQEGDDVIAYLMVQYTDLSLGNVLANAVVAFNTADGSVVKTADGQQYFSFVEHLGTTSTAPGDGVYKIQFQNSTGGGEQWQGDARALLASKRSGAGAGAESADAAAAGEAAAATAAALETAGVVEDGMDEEEEV